MKKHEISWRQYDKDIHKLAKKINQDNKPILNIYGIPKGGLPIAVHIAHLINRPLIIDSRKISSLTLIIDDVSDSGKTLIPFQRHLMATLYYKEKTLVMPTFVVSKKEHWIVFPWER